MEGGELKRQRRESSSSIQVTQGDNAPLLVQDSVGPKYFLCWCCFVVCLFSLVFFFIFFFRLFLLFKILPKIFFFRFFFRVVLHLFDFDFEREEDHAEHTHRYATKGARKW